MTSRGAPEVSGAVLVCGAHRYVVTPSDVLWLARAVAAEGRHELQVAQTLVNLFAYVHSRKPRTAPSLTGIIRAYAQPVNPRWYPAGDLHLHWKARGQDSASAARRRELVHSRSTWFEPDVCHAVERALLRGPLDIPANCTDYAAAWIDASRKYRPLTEPQRGVNRLWTRAPGWTGYQVEDAGATPRQCGP